MYIREGKRNTALRMQSDDYQYSLLFTLTFVAFYSVLATLSSRKGKKISYYVKGLLLVICGQKTHVRENVVMLSMYHRYIYGTPSYSNSGVDACYICT